MSTSTKSKIPVVNLRDYTHGTPEERARFVQVWGDGLKKFGFVTVEGHPVDQALIRRVYDLYKQLFALPEEVKEQYLTIMAEQAEKIRLKAIENYQQALAVARQHHWFNEYSERAEQAIAQLDLTDASIKEFRLRPDHTAPNSGLPNFKQELQ